MLFYIYMQGLDPLTLRPAYMTYPILSLLDALEAIKLALRDGYPASLHIEEMN